MNVLIYIASILGSIAVMAGVYYLIKKYAYAYILVASIGAGIVAAKFIISKDLSLLMSIGLVIVCGLVAGIFAIPALLKSDIDDLEEKLTKENITTANEEK
jgi:hypothetical protein